MKKIILASLLGLMIGSTACEENKEEFLSDYDTIMYFRNSGVQELTCYITGDKTHFDMPVVKAGYNTEALSDAHVTVMDAAQLSVYNSEYGTDYELLTPDCYEFTTDTNLTFAADELYRNVGVSFIPENIRNLGEGNYVLPLVLTSSQDVNEEKNIVFVKPDVVSLQLSIVADNEEHIFKNGGITISVPLKLQIDNLWDFQAKVVLDEESSTMDLDGVSLANDGIVDFKAGGNGTLNIQVSSLEQITGQIGVRIESVIGKEFGFSTEASTVTCSLEPYPLTVNMLSSNAVEPSEGSLANLLDGNVNTYFHSAWSVSVSGTHHMQVNLPENVKRFGFSYTNRSSNGNAAMAWFTVYGGSDENNLETVKSYSWDGDGLPGGAAGKYTSGILASETPINTIRFECNGNWTGGVYFVWSEFKLYVLE